MSIENSHKKAKERALIHYFGENNFNKMVVDVIETKYSNKTAEEIVSSFIAETNDETVNARCVLITEKDDKGRLYKHHITCGSNVFDEEYPVKNLNFSDKSVNSEG